MFAVVLIAVGAACGFPATLSLTAEVVDLDGRANGLISTVAGLAVMAMPAAVPFLAASDPARGFTWLMLATLVMAVMQLAFLVHLLLAKRVVLRQRKSGTSSHQHAHGSDGLRLPLLVAEGG
jgi:MFS family permease